MAIFGTDHVAALLATAVVAVVYVVIARRGRSGPWARGLAVALLAAVISDPFLSLARGELSWTRSLPLDMCDLGAFITAFALGTRSQRAYEYAWFWGLSGTLQGLLTPALPVGFPNPEYFRFFVVHGGIVVGAIYLGPGLGMRPRRGAVWRIYGVTAIYVAVLMGIDFLLDANYMFLRRKPPGSVLEFFGPWPVYILGGAAIAALLFWLLDRVARRPARA